MHKKPHNILLQLSILTTLCALITLPNLASTGLSDSEAHRVIPALHMLETGNYLVPTMFDQPYVRKPQLVPWLFAAAFSINPNLPLELPPRMVSAAAFTLTVFLSFFFARKWFGPNAGFPAGIALTLTPLYWSPARAAEIESIHNLTTAIGAWLAIELLINTKKSFPSKLPWSLALILAALSMLLTKGPAGFPIFLALLISTALLTRSIKSFFNLSILIPLTIAALLFAWHWSNTLTAAGPGAIVQSPNAFMFEPGKLLKLAAFIPTALLTALPITLALLFPWGKDARAESEINNQPKLLHQLQTAKLIALSIPTALLIMMLAGVSNDRYAQPILIPLAPLVGWLFTTNLMPHRQKILRTMTLGSPKIITTLLAVLAIVHITIIEPTKRQSSGKIPAQKLATQFIQSLPPLPQNTPHPTPHTPHPPHTPHTLIADAIIEARPETLLYLQIALKNTDHPLTIHWIPGLNDSKIRSLQNTQNPTIPLLALLRTNPSHNAEIDKLLFTKEIATGTVHEFNFSLVTLPPPSDLPSASP